MLSHERVELQSMLEDYMREALKISDLADEIEEIIISLIVIRINDKIFHLV